jgi:ribosomal protein L16 Arg81 hydroxylase
MSIQAWLGETPKQQFVADYFHKLPFSRSGGGREHCGLGDWQVLDEVLRAAGADVMLAQRGRQQTGELPRSAAAAQALVAEGCTVLVRHAERQHAGIARLAAGFAADFAAPVNVHVYVTPPGQFGFGWHYDAEDVFVLQASGSKEYALRKNTVNPWPLEETLPGDMRYEREIMPLMRCLLSPGDWLYIPAGYWHKAEAQGDQPSISLAVGVMSRTALAVYDQLRGRLLDSLLWRQRLPIVGAASPLSPDELRSRYRELVSQLADDMSNALRREDFLDALLDGRSNASP